MHARIVSPCKGTPNPAAVAAAVEKSSKKKRKENKKIHR
jgi:hypothetical protein